MKVLRFTRRVLDESVDEVLKEKELQLEAVTREIQAFRIAALLLGDAAEVIPKIPAQSEHPSAALGPQVRLEHPLLVDFESRRRCGFLGPLFFVNRDLQLGCGHREAGAASDAEESETGPPEVRVHLIREV